MSLDSERWDRLNEENNGSAAAAAELRHGRVGGEGTGKERKPDPDHPFEGADTTTQTTTQDPEDNDFPTPTEGS